MKKGLVMAIVVFFVAVNFLAIFTTVEYNTNDEQINHVKAYLTGLTAHDPIKIDGDGDLDSAHGVVYDNINDIYNIRLWKIDGGGKGYGIYVANITKTLIISNCEIYNVTGGNYGLIKSNAGIKLYQVRNGASVRITSNYIHDTDSAAVYLAYSGQGSGYSAIDVDTNYIFNAGRAGVYAGISENISLENNAIFRNSVGVHFSNVKNAHITDNGIGENTNEGVRIVTSSHVTIYDNIFYHNRGSGDTYDMNHVQVTQDSSSTYIDWDNGYGNYWHDWAMNNESNWYIQHGLYTTYKLKWGYNIVDSSGNTVNEDRYPVKVKHVAGLSGPKTASFTFGDRSSVTDFPKNLTGSHGVVYGVGTADMPFKVVGTEFNLTGETQPMINIENRVVFINIWVHNSTTDNGADGNGFENLGDYVDFEHVHIFNCSHTGLLLHGNNADTEVLNSYIHNNGFYGISIDGLEYASATVERSTISNNFFGGVDINNTRDAYLRQNIISNNGFSFMGTSIGEGIYVNNTNSPNVLVENNSLFNNIGYGVYLNNGTTYDYTTLTMKNNIFHGNNGATEDYDAKHIQVYVGSGNTLKSVDNNFFNDWVYSHPGLGWHLVPYKFNGTGQDNTPARWVNFTWDFLYIDSDMATYYNYNGTQHGIIGYDGYKYWIEGWNVKTSKNYAGLVVKNVKDTIEIQGCNISNIYGAGIVLTDLPTNVYVNLNVINNNEQEGISAVNTPYISIGENMVTNNGDAGIYVANIDHGFPVVGSNRIYRNGHTYNDYGIELINIHGVSKYSAVDYNQISINYGGIYAYNIDTIRIIRNGIAYNEKYGVKLEGSTGITVENNTFYENNGTTDHFYAKHIQAYDNGNNIWNWSGGGNYWHDWAMNNNTNDPDGNYVINYAYPIDGGKKDAKPFLYIKHLPFRIDSYWDETYDNGVIGGDGTSQYPFVIVGWRVNGNNYGYGIYMGNTSDANSYTNNLYLKMDHCLVSNASGGSGNVYYSNAGIIVSHVYPNSVTFYTSIENTRSENNMGNGLDIIDSRTIDVRYSTFSNNKGRGIYIYDSSYININVINSTHNAYHGIHVYESGVSIDSSNMSYNNDTGVFVYGGVCDIANSEIYRNGYSTASYHDGIVLSAAVGGEIKDNIIKENERYGIYAFNGAHGVSIYRNQFIGNHGASESGQYDSSKIQAYDNGAKYDNLWNTSTEGNCWSDYSGTGAYSIDGGASEDSHPGCGFVPEMSQMIIVVLVIGAVILVNKRKR